MKKLSDKKKEPTPTKPTKATGASSKPLPVMMPARIILLPAEKPERFHAWWQAQLPQKIEFQLISRR